MSVSATLAANEIISQRRQSGEYVLPMAFGEAGLAVHPQLCAALAASARYNGYGPVAGVPELREAAAGYWTRRRLPTGPEQVVAGPGSKPLLYGLMAAIGGDVALAQPSWVSYAAQAELLGAQPMLVPTIAGQGGVPDPDLLTDYLDHARAIGRHIGSIVLTSPDNPTGTLAGEQTMRRVCELAREHDLIIISDEIYRDLYFGADSDFVSPAELAPERTVITTGLSKSLALGGWRLGVARLPDSLQGRALRGRLLTIGSEIWSSAAQPVQLAGAYAFTEPPELQNHIADSKRLHSTVAHAVAEQFTGAGTAVAAPRGGFYIYPDFAEHREHLDAVWSVRTSAELSELLLDKFAIGVLPGSAFGDDPKALKVRVATSQLYGDTQQDRESSLRSAYPLQLPWVRKALAHLETALAELTRR